jgi:hypothetical protein
MNMFNDPRMEKYWARLRWDVRHLFSREINPYTALEAHGVKDPRTGLQDIGHAIRNVWVEWRRLP